ncbi:hypothetical protein [Cellulomonas endophytica]|uniref:hypothetical protein n=1 Tax=Cellulomonas endophytica TaxID=2494735 RepID=UPI001011C93E|nr:hypothetical protein [Cellulomonas endophytica]
MFLSLAKLFADAGGTRDQVLLVHPLQLSRWLDEAWGAAALVPELPVGFPSTNAPFLGDAAIVGALGLPAQPPPPFLLQPSGIVPPDAGSWASVTGPPDPGVGLFWHHLVYAYLVECTGVVAVFTEVVRRLTAGETLGTLGVDSARWLRTTEELFLRDPPLFSVAGVRSEVRPDPRVNRRNAYWRMFGMDLPHPLPAAGGGDPAQQDWKAHTGLGVNTDFRAKWSELLRQVWLGQENFGNTSGANPTDPSYVAFLCTALKDSMNNRRRGGQLAREEFVHVTALSWFQLTLEADTPIVVDLQARASSPADRLAMVAQRVGMAPAPRSRELLELAEPVSSVLRAIELGLFDDPVAAGTLFDRSTTLGVEMGDLINLWQSATGERVKDRPGAGTVPISAAQPPSAAQPLRIPAPAPAPPPAARPALVTAAASNGLAR